MRQVTSDLWILLVSSLHLSPGCLRGTFSSTFNTHVIQRWNLHLRPAASHTHRDAPLLHHPWGKHPGHFFGSLPIFLWNIRYCQRATSRSLKAWVSLHAGSMYPLFLTLNSQISSSTFEMPVVPLISISAVHISWGGCSHVGQDI